MIQGWDVGFSSMCVGEEAVLTCRADYAYGPEGGHGIPPNATLTFEVQVLDSRVVGADERAAIDAKVASLRR